VTPARSRPLRLRRRLLTGCRALESSVRSYCRRRPTVFDRAQGSRLTDENGRTYLGLFAGAGSLNYGHNNPVLKRALIDYLGHDGITLGLDMHTTAKRSFPEC
jgi:diaminobutyrate-2-oxoglutarate transaminase